MDLLITNGYIVLENALDNAQCELYKKYIDDIFLETPDADGLEIDGYERNKTYNNELSECVRDILGKHMDISNCHVFPYWYPTRYVKGGGLGIHCDGSAYDEDKGSSYTILVYLNDDFEGGRTVFVDDYDEEEIVNENSRYVIPKSGMILLLEQNRLHFAEKVSNGTKYILRGDVLM